MRSPRRAPATFGWAHVARIGLVQAGIGAVIVLMTSTLNRVMVVELGLPASVPGALVFLHFAAQLALRPRMGFASDLSRRRTAGIIGGMAILAVSGTGAAASVALAATARAPGLALAVASFLGMAFGVSAAGTPLLALLSERTPAARQPRAAATVWLMMIAGFILTTVCASAALDPFSFDRLVLITATVGVVAFLVAIAALWGLESGTAPVAAAAAGASGSPARGQFREALAEVWKDPPARRFAIFIFVSMLAYNAQDLILEPFTGTVFGLVPAESTRISSLHQGGLLAGMLLAAALAARIGSVREWAAAGCLVSSIALIAVALSPVAADLGLLRVAVVTLGIGNGVFAIGALGAMMALCAGTSRGLRMGVFGGAQAVAFAVGGLLGATGSDLLRSSFASAAKGYAGVFVLEAVAFAGAAGLAAVSIPRGRMPEVMGASGSGAALVEAIG